MSTVLYILNLQSSVVAINFPQSLAFTAVVGGTVLDCFLYTGAIGHPSRSTYLALRAQRDLHLIFGEGVRESLVSDRYVCNWTPIRCYA